MERRALSVVRERLEWNRLHTPEESAQTSSQFKGEAKVLNLEHDTFQNPIGDVVFWVLDGPMDGKTEEATPLGVIYGFEWWPAEAQPPLRGWEADIVWHDSFPDQPLLVLSHNLSSDLTIAVFPIDLDKRLAIKPLSLVNQKKKDVKYTKPLVPITELRTELSPEGGVSNRFERCLRKTVVCSWPHCPSTADQAFYAVMILRNEAGRNPKSKITDRCARLTKTFGVKKMASRFPLTI